VDRGSAVRDRLGYQQALGAVSRYALATVTEQSMSMHRLVQAVIRHGLDRHQQQRWAAIATRVILAGFPKRAGDTDTWPAAAGLLTHVLVVTTYSAGCEIDPQATVQLLNRAGDYLRERADQRQARPLLDRALSIAETCLGLGHLDTAETLNILGITLHGLNELPAASLHLERALDIRETQLGYGHPDTAETLNYLGILQRALGDRGAARVLHERSLAIREAHLGFDSQETAESLKRVWGLS
jgi:tetratricopeptide (TPR) repeat protein